MQRSQHQQHWQLFTVRLWAEDLGNDQREWRGQVQHVISGEARSFRDWQMLIAWLQAMLPTCELPPDRD